MDYLHRLNISYYKTIAVINEEHQVFLVQHQDTKKIYVKKILDIYNPEIYAYLAENTIIGIPKIVDTYEENEQLTIIEEFASGVSLQELITSKKLSIDDIGKYICELCDILEKLHSVNPPIVHRDIKPSNIIITFYNHIVLIDFNAAKYLNNTNASDTVLLGTKGYAAPEQYGFGSSTPQTDIYAIGILLKELTLALENPTVEFEGIIKKCTQLNPDDRFKSVKDLKQAIKSIRKNRNEPTILLQVKPLSWKSFTIPGYRTVTPWKMILSTLGYIFILWLSLSLEVKDAFGIDLWIQRISCLFIMVSMVFISCNYCGVQRLLPLCKSKVWIVHFLGVILLNCLSMSAIFMIMYTVLSVL